MFPGVAAIPGACIGCGSTCVLHSLNSALRLCVCTECMAVPARIATRLSGAVCLLLSLRPVRLGDDEQMAGVLTATHGRAPMATSARRIVSVATAISGHYTLTKPVNTQTLNPNPQVLVLTPSPSAFAVLSSPSLPRTHPVRACCVPGSGSSVAFPDPACARARATTLTVTEELQVRVGRCRRAKRVSVLVRKLHFADEGQVHGSTRGAHPLQRSRGL